MREDPVINAPIESLQLMLRTISFANGDSISVIPDGIYGDSTTKSVSEFQGKNGIPVTGIADDITFRAIVSAYNIAAKKLGHAQSSVVIFPAQLIISPGQYHPHIALAQAMFFSLHQEFAAFYPAAVSGILDDTTVQNIRFLQQRSGLPETGSLDKATWNYLNMLYRAMFDRNFAPSQG